MRALRADVVVGATAKVICPFPAPFVPDEMLIQFAVAVAVHGQRGGAVTVKLPLPPLALKLWLLADKV